MTTTAESELRAAFAALATLAVGPAVDPNELVLHVFGPDARAEIRSPGSGAPRWFDTRVIVRVDSAWHEGHAVTAIARELARLGVRTRLGRLVRSGTSDTYRLVLELVLERPPDAAPEPRREIGEARGVFGDPPSVEACSHCGARHRIYTPRKPFPGAEGNDEQFLCLACGRGLFRARSWEGTSFRAELVDEPA